MEIGHLLRIDTHFLIQPLESTRAGFDLRDADGVFIGHPNGQTSRHPLAQRVRIGKFGRLLQLQHLLHALKIQLGICQPGVVQQATYGFRQRHNQLGGKILLQPCQHLPDSGILPL